MASRFVTQPGRKLKPAPKKTKARVPVKPKQAAKPKAPAVQPFDANAPLTADTLNQNVQAASDLQYGGQEQALQGQRGVNAQMAQNVPVWFGDYQRALAQATQQTAGAYGAALAVQQNTAQSSSALDAQQRATMMQGLQADATARGATIDPALAAQGQQAAASRRGMLDQFSGLTANQGAAQVTYGANRQVVGAGQKLTAQLGEAQRTRNIGVQAQDLARQKGQFAVNTRQQLIDKEHTKLLENQAFGLNVEKAKADVAAQQQTAADRRAARVTANRNADASRQVSADRLSETQRHNRTQEQLAAQRAATSKRGGQTPAQIAASRKAGQKTRVSIDTAAADAKTLLGHKAPVTTPDGKVEVDKNGKPTQRTRNLSQAEIRAAVRKKYKDRDIANAAMDLAVNGYISPVNQRRLRARHIPIPADWLRKRPKVKPKLSSSATLTLGGPTISQRMPK